MADDEARYEIVSRKDAKRNGLMYYFTGRPCKRGHIVERLVSSEMCVQCSRELSAIRHAKNRDVYLKRMRARYWGNRERDLAYAHRYYSDNKDALREKSKKWRNENPEKARLSRANSWKKHRNKRLVVNKKWRMENQDRVRAIKSNRRARKNGNGGEYTGADVAAIIKYQRNRCAYCRVKLGKKYHIDHIIPLARGGSNDRRNLQVLCAPCNLSKHARDPIDHARSLGMLL